MRKVAVGIGMLMVGGLSAFAGEFPYTTNLNQRYYTNETTLASYELVDVPKVGQGMLDGENVAVITMDDAVMTALDEDGWAECTNALAASGIQAAFTLKSVSDDSTDCQWMGYTSEGWKAFTGPDAKAGTYDVKIEIDYSLQSHKVRYSVNDIVMTLNDTEWVDLGGGKSRVESVQLCGYGTTGAVEGKAAARPAEGNVSIVEDVSSNYKSIRLGIAATGVWGVNNVNVVVKDSAGNAVGMVNQALSEAVDGTNYVDLASSYVKPGETYTYEVKLTDTFSSRTTEPHVSQPVNLFSSDAWFQFTGTAFTNATSDGITIANNKFFATDEEVEGLVTPTSDPKANLGTVVTTEIEVSNVCTELTNFTANIPQFAVALGGSNQSRVWKYCESGAWKDGPAGLPTENGTYVGRATFDYASRKVKYEIKTASGEYQLLVEAAQLPSVDRLNKVGILGGGNVSGLVAELKLAEPPPVSDDDITPPETGTDGKIKLHNNTEVGLDKLNKGSYVMENDPGKNCHLKWKDADNKMGKIVNGKLTVLDANIQNGVSSSYDSYVLGLDAEVATDRPAAVVKPGASQKEGDNVFVPVYVPNLNNTRADELGYTIKLVLEKKNDSTWEPVAGKTQEIDPTTGEPKEGQPDMAIPLDGGIYRVNTVIE